MNQVSGVVLCLAYIIGLMVGQINWGGYVLLGLGVLAAILFPILIKTKPKPRRQRTQDHNNTLPPSPFFFLPYSFFNKWLWISAGIIGFLASIYFQYRIPVPDDNDISKLLDQQNYQNTLITVYGEIESTPRLTRAGKIQFILEAKHVNEINGIKGPANVNKPVTGKIYVTAPLLQGTGLYPGATVGITGKLYAPQKRKNPGGFDFKEFLENEGIFAGFSARKIAGNETGESPPLSFFSIRRRIVKPIIQGLGIPEGALVSAIALGKQAIDLPYNIKDTFVLAGLAHAIAASGTQVSLILGVVLALTKRFSKTIKFTLGITSLIILLGLTGLEPSIVRAAFMGVLTLIAIVLERQIKPLGALLLAATVLLLINPLWIQDLGFQLSFLATLGLVVTAPPLMKILDFLPTPIASLIAIPIAASIWTLPRLAAVFNCLLPYCIITNILASVLITIISIGGFITAIASLLVPPLGKAVSSLLYYPTHGLIKLADYFANLPGNRVNVGTVSLIQEIALYSLFIVVWGIGTFREQQREAAKTQKQKVKPQKGLPLVPFALIIAICIIVLPAWKYQISTFKVTILANTKEPVLVSNKRGEITLINSGIENDVTYTVFPFLAQEGVNQIKYAIATHTRLGLSAGWSNLIGQLPIQNFYDIPSSQQAYYNSNQTFLKTLKVRQGIYTPLQENQTIALDSLQVNVINSDAPVVQFQIDNKKWLLVGDLPINAQNTLALNGNIKDIKVILWSGIPLSPEFISVIQPEIAIASGNAIDAETERRLRVAKTLIYLTSQDGAIEWTPEDGFRPTLESDENLISWP